MRSGSFKVFESKSSVYWPHCVRCKALLTGPEADVHFREGAVERFSGIIRGEERAMEHYRKL